MDAHAACCRYEPSLEDLLSDDIMTAVLRSAGYDAPGLREMMVETARRLRSRDAAGGPEDDA